MDMHDDHEQNMIDLWTRFMDRCSLCPSPSELVNPPPLPSKAPTPSHPPSHPFHTPPPQPPHDRFMDRRSLCPSPSELTTPPLQRPHPLPPSPPLQSLHPPMVDLRTDALPVHHPLNKQPPPSNAPTPSNPPYPPPSIPAPVMASETWQPLWRTGDQQRHEAQEDGQS